MTSNDQTHAQAEMPAGWVSVSVTVDRAPDDDRSFADWCKGYGFNVLNSGRRAWCSQFSTYFRDAIGVATTKNGESFLVYADDLGEAALAGEEDDDDGQG